jgi:NAD(P)-dependent dehydrogenase (short-subunit alcohol dehydrogenase family)
MNRLENKVALVTGGGSGIGKAIAIAYAKEGADVCIAGRTLSKVEDTAHEIEKLGRKALAIKADVLKIPEIESMVEATIKQFGKIDILVNNAGIVTDIAILDITEEKWDEMIGVDLKGSFFCAQKVLPYMLKQGKGKIINIASPLSVEGKPENSIYCAAKGGVINMTRALGLELALKHINVNAIAPGFTDTNMTTNFTSDPKMLALIIPRIPAGRIAQPEDITGAAVYLASDESDFVIGATIFVDGGETAQ